MRLPPSVDAVALHGCLNGISRLFCPLAPRYKAMVVLAYFLVVCNLAINAADAIRKDMLHSGAPRCTGTSFMHGRW